MELSCYGCKHLIQGGDGENGCCKIPDPYNFNSPHQLDEDPKPLYDDCFEKGK